jgi:hypothetical protein
LPLPEFAKVPSGDTVPEALRPVKTRGNKVVPTGEILNPGEGDRQNRGTVNDDWFSSDAQRESNKGKQRGGREHLGSGVKRKKVLEKSEANA